MVNFKGGAIISLIINGSLWTISNLWFTDTRKTWVVIGFLILTILGFLIMLSSIMRYIINLKANPTSLAGLTSKVPMLKIRKITSLILIGLLGGLGAANYHLSYGQGAEGGTIAVQDLTNPAPDQGIISLTFDDALISTYQTAGPILAAAGQTGIIYSPTGFVGKPGFTSWDQIQELSNQGWEIGAHTVNHIELPKYPNATVKKEFTDSLAELKNHGYTGINFAAPYGAYDNNTTAEIAKFYNSQRAFHNQGLNRWPYNKYLLYVRHVTRDTTASTAKLWVDEALAQKQWLIFVFHDVFDSPNQGDGYAWTSDKLQELANYLNEKNIKAQRIDTILNGFNNLIPNSSFASNLNGWTTDSKLYMRVDSNNNGSFPSPKQSLRITGNSKASHLFGPKIAVDPDILYGMRTYLDTRLFSRGEIGFVIDEYDQKGNWISWQWFGGVQTKNVIDYSFRYKPSSSNVALAATQIYQTAGSTGVTYLDNLEFFTNK